MSLDGYWPMFPKSINEKVWQKKKGILAVKKTGISEKIAEAEAAFDNLKPALYSRIAVDIETPEGAEKAAKAINGDKGNVKAFVKSMNDFAAHCASKAAEFKKNKLVPKAVGEFLEEMAGDARKCGADVLKHVEAAAKEVDDAVNALSEDKNIPVAKECIETAYQLIDEWDELFPGKMKELEEMEKELNLLNKEMDSRLEGKVDQPADELKEPLKRIRDDAQKVQDVMLGKKAYAALKVVKQVRGITKTIKNDQQFNKDFADPFEARANKFIEQREKLNVVSANLIGDAGLSFSLLQDGLKDEEGVMKEVAKFAEIFYGESSPNSVEKTREHVEDIAGKAKEIINGLRQQPIDKDALRTLKQKGDDSVVKVDNSIFALRGALKTSARLARGRFEKHPMIGNSLKKMAIDVDTLQKASIKNKEVYERLASRVLELLSG